MNFKLSRLNSYEVYVMLAALIFGAASKPLSWWITDGLISTWECSFVSANWVNRITQSSCNAFTDSIEWVVHYPILYLLYYFNLWLFLGGIMALTVNLITEGIVSKPKFLDFLEKTIDILGPAKTFVVSLVVSFIICQLTPLDDWYYQLYKVIS